MELAMIASTMTWSKIGSATSAWQPSRKQLRGPKTSIE